MKRQQLENDVDRSQQVRGDVEAVTSPGADMTTAVLFVKA